MSSSSAPPPLPPASSNRSRVKLYTLNEERQWEDRGTGFVSCLAQPSHALLVKSELDGSTLLESKVQLQTKYQKQQETLIVWSEGENYDLALSFQEKAGCDEIWESICEVQGKDAPASSSSFPAEPAPYESDEDSTEHYLSAALVLPPVDLAHLREITELFQAERVRDATRRDYLARALESQGYVRKLLELFHVCEELEDRAALQQLYEIVRAIFYLNKSTLFELLFAEELILDVIGCLEYEPGGPRRHRDFLRRRATFKEVIPIGSAELLAKIHQTYRIQYIQDAILPAPSLFEENLLSTMNSFLFFNKVEIVTLLYEDPKFLSQLFATLKDDQLDEEKRKDLMLFLKEFCVFSQTLQQQNRDNFFQALATHGILNVIQVMLSLDDVTTKQASLDVFASIVECNPSTVREYMLQETQSTQDDDELLLNLVIAELQADPDPELSGALHLLNYLKLLIDPENMLAVAVSEKTEFLSFFYFRSMAVLLAPLMANTSALRLARDDFHLAQLQHLLLDFLTFCLEHHTYHMRNFLNKKDLLRRVLVLLQSKHQFLQLSALRFFRRLVALKDEQYNLAIVRHDYFAPLVAAFKANKRRYNLLNSALIELFEFLRQEDVKPLIHYFVANFAAEFESVSYVKTFRELKLRYEAHRDKRERVLSASSSSGAAPPFLPLQRFRQAEDDEDEEKWFSGELEEKFRSRARFTSSNSDEDEEEEEEAEEEDPPVEPSSAISSNEPEEEELPRSSQSLAKKPASEGYPMVKSPALSNIADQYNDEDEDEDEEANSEAHSTSNKRKLEEADEQAQVFKKTSEQLES